MTTTRKWAGPAIFLVFGGATMVASLVAGHPADGAWALGLSVVFAVGLLAGGRSELVRTLRGDPDERGAHVTEVTSSIVLNLLAAAAVVGAVWEQARGVHLGPWTLACVIGGALYLVTFLVVRARL